MNENNMFGKNKKIKELEEKNKKLLDVNEQLRYEADRLYQMSKTIQKNAMLVAINQVKKKNIFQFIRDGESYTIETYSTTADNPAQWRKDLLD